MMSKSDTRSKSKLVVLSVTLIVPFLAVVALMVSAGSGQIQTAPADAKVHPVEVLPLTTQTAYSKQKLAYGRIEAVAQSRIGFELTGVLTNVLVAEGQEVKSGQILASLDTQRLEARKRELEASLANARANARLAELSQVRVTDLVSKKLESAQRLDEVVQTSAAADARVEEIRARLLSLEVELDKSNLYAPFDGYVLTQTIDVGTVVNAGQSILELQQTDGYEVRIALAADDAFSLQRGKSYELQKDQTTIPAVLKSIARQRNLATRTVEVIFSLDSTVAGLLPGDLLAFGYDQSVTQAGVWVPRQSLSSGVRGLWTLYTVEQGAQQKLTQKAVELLYTEPHRAYVRGTLADGELLVVNGTQRLVPGQLVYVTQTVENTFALEQHNEN